MVDLSRRSMLTGSWRNASNGILPPWARETTYFLAHCLRCDACIQACEADILQRGAGGYPSVDFKRGECSFCYACAQACNGCGACVAICPVSAIKAENHHAH
ncbi:hypothetical protein FB43_13715 [Salmonella enterica subsp. enterica]|nr:hypothetical protein [Salmonella enterica subsp. enterica serovar 4,[5],12:i:-]